jgi:hypothetical protein
MIFKLPTKKFYTSTAFPEKLLNVKVGYWNQGNLFFWCLSSKSNEFEE